MEFDTKVGSENNIKRKHKTRKLSTPRPFRVPKDFLQCSQKQPEIIPEFSGFYSLRACFCLAIIPTTESCEKARADRVVSALPALKVNLRHWERKHLRNFDFKTDSWTTQGYLCLLCSLAFYWDTCGSPVIKCLCFFVIFFFFPATKWKNYAIVPSGHWALNTMTTNCDPMRVKVFTC